MLCPLLQLNRWLLGAIMKVSHAATEAAGPSICFGTDPTERPAAQGL